MEIQSHEKFNIFIPYNPVLNNINGRELLNRLEKSDKATAINMQYIQDCTYEFIEELRALCLKKNIGIFNISSDIFAIFNFMNVDKFAKLYAGELDFIENTRQLINRNFALV